MKYWFDLYRANLRVAIASMLQYRFTILIWAVWGFVGPLISLAVWSAASAARGGTIVNKSTGASFAAGDFAAYFLVYMIFGHLMMSWDAMEFAGRVQNGGLSPTLLKPVHPIHRDAASNIAFKLTTSAMLLPVWALLFWMLKPHITLNAALPAGDPGAGAGMPCCAMCCSTSWRWSRSGPRGSKRSINSTSRSTVFWPDASRRSP